MLIGSGARERAALPVKTPIGHTSATGLAADNVADDKERLEQHASQVHSNADQRTREECLVARARQAAWGAYEKKGGASLAFHRTEQDVLLDEGSNHYA